MSKKQKVIVGLSGGVDSSVAALLLKEKGYDVHGVFMKNWEQDDDEYCTAADDYLDAKSICAKLDIPLEAVNFSKEYHDRVFAVFLKDLKKGITPNPDILCNSEIKFRAFLDHAYSKGADFIATGHYVRTKHENTGVTLKKGIDANKDQSYFLHQLTQDQLLPALFPIGDYEKPAIRDIALKHGLITHNKKDSTGICFIGERKFKSFLEEYLLNEPGEIVSVDGDNLGSHDGLIYYTIGQRQGLKIGGLKDKAELPWYVCGKVLADNKLIVCQGVNHNALFQQELVSINTHFISGNAPTKKELSAKIRYRQDDNPCSITKLKNDTYSVVFETPQRAVTPGQYVVFYEGDFCLGGGVIS